MPDEEDQPERILREGKERPTRREKRGPSERAFKLAKALMEMKPDRLRDVELDEDLREEVNRSRQITHKHARGREMRRLCVVVQREDLDELEIRILGAPRAEVGDAEVEEWRTALLADDVAKARLRTEKPHAKLEQLDALVDAAREERDSGEAGNARRALFRAIRVWLS